MDSLGELTRSFQFHQGPELKESKKGISTAKAFLVKVLVWTSARMVWAPGGRPSDRIIPMISFPLTSSTRPRSSAVRFSPFLFPSLN